MNRKVICAVCNQYIDIFHFKQHLKKYHNINNIIEYGELYNIPFFHNGIKVQSKCLLCASHFNSSAYSGTLVDNELIINISRITGCKCPKDSAKNSKLKHLMIYGHLNYFNVDRFKNRFTLEWYINKLGLERGTETYKNKNQKSAGSLKAFIDRDGIDEGSKKYEEFIKKVGYSNTLPHYIDKYGEEYGTYLYNDRIQRLKSNNKRGIVYWLKKGYNLEQAKEKQKEFNSLGSNLEYLQEKYGYDEGTERYNKALQKKIAAGIKKLGRYSKISQSCFLFIIQYFNFLETCCFYAKNERVIKSSIYKNKHYKLDFFYSKLPLWIEFNGDFWHANPKLYDTSYKLNVTNSNAKTVQEIWDDDKKRIDDIFQTLHIKPYIIWEYDWNTDREQVLFDLKKYIEGLI